MDVSIVLNGCARQLSCQPGDTLLALLRREGCVSVRYGSGTGETGAAAVLLDGRLVSADVLLAAQADGHEVTTVESLNVATGELHPIQEAFVEAGALQSGYSAGAMVLATKALLDQNPDPDRGRDPGRVVRDPRPRDRLREGGGGGAARRGAAAGREARADAAGDLRPAGRPGVPRARPVAPREPWPMAGRARRRGLAGCGRDRRRRQAGAQGGRAAAGQGQPRLHRRRRAARDAAREGAAQPARPRPDPRDRRRRGEGNARRARGAPPLQHAAGEIRVRGPELAQPASVGPGELRRHGSPRRRPGGGGGGGHGRARRGGLPPDRGDLRGPARGVRRDRGHGRGRAPHPRRAGLRRHPRRRAQHQLPHRGPDGGGHGRRAGRRRSRFRADLPPASGPALLDRAACHDRLARRGRAAGPAHVDPGALPRPADGGPAARAAGQAGPGDQAAGSAAASVASRRC